jgi:hypothetical protein
LPWSPTCTSTRKSASFTYHLAEQRREFGGNAGKIHHSPGTPSPFYGQGFPLQMLDSVIREAEQSAQAASLAARNMFEKVSAAASVPVTASSSEDGPVTAEWREIAGPAARIIVPKPAQPI